MLYSVSVTDYIKRYNGKRTIQNNMTKDKQIQVFTITTNIYGDWQWGSELDTHWVPHTCIWNCCT